MVIVSKLSLVILLSCIASSLAADCAFSGIPNIKCPTSYGKPPNYCASASLSGSTIIRCANGCPTPNTCSEILLNNPPEGPKPGAVCWDEGDGGNAQCTYDCVEVTALNGTTFYPVGCKSLNVGNGGESSASATCTSSLAQPEESTLMTRNVTLAPGPVVVGTKTGQSSTGTGGAASTSIATRNKAVYFHFVGTMLMLGRWLEW